MNNKVKKWVLLSLRILVLTTSVVFIIFKVDLNVLFSTLKKISIWILVISVLIAIFRVWLNGIRWKLVNTDDLQQLSNWDYFRYMMMSSTFNLIMPGALGGDIVKAIWVSSDTSRNRVRNVLSIFFDRAIGFLSLFILGLVAFSFSYFFSLKLKLVIWSVSLVIFILFILLIWLVKKGLIKSLLAGWLPKKKIPVKIKEIFFLIDEITLFYLKKPRVFIFALFLSFVIHATFFAINYLIAYSIGIRIHFFDISMASCIVWFITVIPLSISGIGLREISYISILGHYGVSAESATAMSLYIFSISILVGLAGLPFIFIGKKKTKSLPGY